MEDLNINISSEGTTLIHYRGAVTHDIIETMSGVLMKKLKAFNENTGLVMSLYGIFIELAQNIERYSEEKQNTENHTLSYGTIRIKRNSQSNYTAETCNKISEKNIKNLEDYLIEITSLDYVQLKERYRKQLMASPEVFSPCGKLGILEMAVKSRNNIEYEFKEAEKGFYFFSIKITLGG